MFDQLREDIACIHQRDPAARSRIEILTCYPGLHAILIHRLAHGLWRRGWYWAGRFVSHLGRLLTGIEIHPGAVIGRRVYIDHGFGVINEHPPPDDRARVDFDTGQQTAQVRHKTPGPIPSAPP